MSAFFILLAWSSPGFGGDTPPPELQPAEVVVPEPALNPDSQISRDDWKQRIDQARQRAAQARRDWALRPPEVTPDPDTLERIASERVLADDTLEPGDIVATDKGLYLFRGQTRDGQLRMFTPLPH
jgi:hypothetical protein